MGGETIIAAVVGAVSGGGGVRLLGRLVGPERDTKIAEYYRGVIKGLWQENEDLRGNLHGLQNELEELRNRIVNLELERDSPPGFLS